MTSVSTETAFERLAEALELDGQKVIRSGSGQISAQCPAHPDRSPSLSVTAIEGSVLLYCHAGCDTDVILDHLKLTRADLYDSRRGATYSYDDGRHVHRSPDKSFRQSGNTKGTAQLYRLSQVVSAVKEAKPVAVVEGEKDVHALETIGVAATCSPMGAGKAHKADWSPLRGATVAIIADKDEPGEKHACQVLDILRELDCDVTVWQAKEGKDAADHIAAGYGPSDFVPLELEGDSHAAAQKGRRVVLTSAASIQPRRVRWLWEDRVALGSLALLAGREGVGKSTLAYTLAGRITRGELSGEHLGTARSVMVCATEDSWEHTIVPRLMAAEADLSRVYRVEVMSADDIQVGLSLPRDLLRVEESAREVEAALLLLDPLMSRLDGDLDTHRDGDVRKALEPLVAVADRAGFAVVGLIHHNKSGSTDPLNLVMASKAFTAVARSVHTVIPDPDDENPRMLFGTPKNNLGRTDLPTLAFTIASHPIETGEGTAWTARVVWGDELTDTIGDLMRRAADDPDRRSAVDEAADWLMDYVQVYGPRVASSDVKAEGKKAGHSEDSLKRARRKLKLKTESEGFPRITYWSTPPVGATDPPVGATVGATPRGDTLTALTDSLAPTVNGKPAGQAQSVQLEQLEGPQGHGATDLPPLDDCPHGIPGGLQPDPFVNGRLRCPQCRAQVEEPA